MHASSDNNITSDEKESVDVLKAKLQVLGVSTKGLFDRSDLEIALKREITRRQQNELIEKRSKEIAIQKIASDMNDLDKLNDIEIFDELRRLQIDFDPMEDRRLLNYRLASAKYNIETNQFKSRNSTIHQEFKSVISIISNISDEIKYELNEIIDRLSITDIKNNEVLLDKRPHNFTNIMKQETNMKETQLLNETNSVFNAEKLIKEFNRVVEYSTSINAIDGWCKSKSPEDVIFLLKYCNITVPLLTTSEYLCDLLTQYIIKKTKFESSSKASYYRESEPNKDSEFKAKTKNLQEVLPEKKKIKFTKRSMSSNDATLFDNAFSLLNEVSVSLFNTFRALIRNIIEYDEIIGVKPFINRCLIFIETSALRFTHWSSGDSFSSSSVSLGIAMLCLLMRKGILGYVTTLLTIRLMRLLFSTRSNLEGSKLVHD